MNTTADLPTLEVHSSPLLRAALAEDRFHVTDYFRAGDYPHPRTEKDEVERFVSAFLSALRKDASDALLGVLDAYVRAMFPPDEITAAKENSTLPRLLAFAGLQHAVDDALDRMELASFDPPHADDPVFRERPELFSRLDKDGLLQLAPDEVTDSPLVSQGVGADRNTALYPHPLLAPMRELVVELLELASDPSLSVSIALHPYRVTTIEEVPTRLLEDYWSGIKVTPENLDSLDPHDVGVRTFHAARQDNEVQRFFFRLLGSWFDWERRSRHDADDPVKRLYIREVRPAVDRRGALLAAVHNRELHAERDTRARRFTHVDGKVCCYDTERYAPSVERPNAPLDPPERARKLWRVNGHLSDERWCTLVGLHFRQNELVEEHFAEAFSSA